MKGEIAVRRKGRSSQLDRSGTRDSLAQRLDGARDLFLLALGFGERGTAHDVFGRMIRKARVHFASVIEECRITGLQTGAIAQLLGKMYPELADSMRPEVWTQRPEDQSPAPGQDATPLRRGPSEPWAENAPDA